MSLSIVLEALQREFDEAFVRPAQDIAESAKNLYLVVQVGDRVLGLRLEQLSGLHRTPTITHLPGGPAEQLGLVVVEGRVLVARNVPGTVPRREAPWLLALKGGRVGLLVDSIVGVDAFGDDALAGSWITHGDKQIEVIEALISEGGQR